MQELEQRSFQKRQVAYKVSISNILNGNFVKDGASSGYIKFGVSSISRVNILGIIVHKSEAMTNYGSVVIDDGTGKIQLKSFEKVDVFSKFDIGDVVLTIGRIREYNNERYIAPEILKKLTDAGWMNVRKFELKKNGQLISGDTILAVQEIEKIDNNLDAYQEIYSLIKAFDNGEGISVEDVIKKFDKVGAEAIINKLLEKGDIFEIRPGKLKVLE